MQNLMKSRDGRGRGICRAQRARRKRKNQRKRRAGGTFAKIGTGGGIPGEGGRTRSSKEREILKFTRARTSQTQQVTAWSPMCAKAGKKGDLTMGEKRGFVKTKFMHVFRKEPAEMDRKGNKPGLI